MTAGTMALSAATDGDGRPCAEMLRLANLNATFETGIDNPMDAAIVEAGQREGLTTSGWTKVDEIPYDFVRRRLTIVVESQQDGPRHVFITKGAVTRWPHCWRS